MKISKMILLVEAFVCASAFSQAVNKRGICYNSFDNGEVEVLSSSKVSWGYNWYQSPVAENVGGENEMEFMPMIWGAGEDFNEMMDRAREYLSVHKNVKVLLGFNEPMMKNQYGGCDLTPKTAAKLWPELEKLAKEFNVELASPALTWGFEPLTEDGKIWGTPESWMDEWIKQYKKMNHKKSPRFDYLVLHSYMDYPQAVMWFCDKYGEMYNKKVLLTEFCAWDQDPNQIPHQNAKEQIISMSQKVEAMDKDERVAGYAWFMSHAEVNKIPYNSIFTKKESNGELTELGKVYLYMSDGKSDEWYTPGQIIPAYNYISSSNYNFNVGTKPEDGERFNTPVGLCSATDNSDEEIFNQIPLELGNFSNKRFANYQVNIPESGEYNVELRILTDKVELYSIIIDEKEIVSVEVEGTDSEWKTISIPANLPEGKHILQIKTVGNAKTAKFYWAKIN